METLSRKAHANLLNRILTGELTPGTILNRRQVANELDMSIAPVAEAMLTLQNQGFLQAIGRKGTRVCLVTSEIVFSHMMIRESLECQGARLYCGDPVKGARKELEPLARQIDNHYRDNLDPQILFTQWQEEKDLHLSLMRLAGLAELSIRLADVLDLSFFFEVNTIVPFRQEENHGSHVKLLKDLETGDPDKAEGVIRGHLRASRASFIRKFTSKDI